MPKSPLDALQGLVDVLHGTDVVVDGDLIEFAAEDLYVIANVEELTDRVRIRIYLPADEAGEVERWVTDQPAPSSGIIQMAQLEEEWSPRLVFERPLAALDWPKDPLKGDVDRYLAAWHADQQVSYSTGTHPPFRITDDPRDLAPESAWLLKGSEASFPTPDALREDLEGANVGIFSWDWTTASQTQIGDLVLFYFVEPRKAVHFVARAASRAFFSRDLEVQADRTVNRAQWWGYFTTPIEIEPILVAELRAAAHGYLPLRGRSGHFLTPEFIRSLTFTAANPAEQAALDRVVRVPVGIAELPEPEAVDFETWRAIAAGALHKEALVERYVVGPLLRDVLEGSGLNVVPQYPIGRRRVDFAVLDGTRPVTVVEVKKTIKNGPFGDWDLSPDFAQMRWYADQVGTCGVLIDSHRVLLVEPGGLKPAREVVRVVADVNDIQAIRQHILKGWQGG